MWRLILIKALTRRRDSTQARLSSIHRLSTWVHVICQNKPLCAVSQKINIAMPIWSLISLARSCRSFYNWVHSDSCVYLLDLNNFFKVYLKPRFALEEVLLEEPLLCWIDDIDSISMPKWWQVHWLELPSLETDCLVPEISETESMACCWARMMSRIASWACCWTAV